MSRSQQNQVFNQTSGESGQAFGDAENAYKTAQTDIGDYQAQLGRYAAENPYLPGGEFANSENEIIANTSDAGARAAGASLQEEAARTGQNPGAVIGATGAMERQGARDIAAGESGANRERIAGEAGYNKSVLAGSEFPVQAEEAIASGQGGLYGKALGVQEDAAKTPSFMDELGDSFGQSFGKAAGSDSAALLFG